MLHDDLRNLFQQATPKWCAWWRSGLMDQPNLMVCTRKCTQDAKKSHQLPSLSTPPLNIGYQPTPPCNPDTLQLRRTVYIMAFNTPKGITAEDGNSNICRNTDKLSMSYAAYLRKQKSYIKLQPRRPKDTSFICVFWPYFCNIMAFKYNRIFAKGVWFLHK